jgi:hypothetical protein
MHARIDQLLSLRDGEPVDAKTREHAASCAVCTASLRRLSERRNQLHDLPQLDAPNIDFARIRDRATKPARSVASRGYRWDAMAAAAIVAAVIAGVAAVGRYGQHQASQAQLATVPIKATKVLHPTSEPNVAQLVERSRELDLMLQRMPRRPEVQRVSLAGTVDRIEQRVQWLDMQLSSIPDVAVDDAMSRRIWRERVDLMDSLVAVRYSESLPRSALPRSAYSSEPPG